MCLNSSVFLRFFCLLPGIGMLCLAACSKKENEPVPFRTNEVKATLNEQSWQANVSNTATHDGLRQIFALKPDGSSLRLYFPEDYSGTYNLATDQAVTIAYYKDDVFWNTKISGSLEVTQNTANVLEGSFNTQLISIFNQDTISLENGTFYWHR